MKKKKISTGCPIISDPTSTGCPRKSETSTLGTWRPIGFNVLRVTFLNSLFKVHFSKSVFKNSRFKIHLFEIYFLKFVVQWNLFFEICCLLKFTFRNSLSGTYFMILTFRNSLNFQSHFLKFTFWNSFFEIHYLKFTIWNWNSLTKFNLWNSLF